MNELLDINKDEEICNIVGPSVEEVRQYEDDVGPGPTLKPMRPHFSKNMRCCWNDRLGDLFLKHLTDKLPNRLGSETKEQVRDMFDERLERLKRHINLAKRLPGESPEGVEKRLSERRQDILAKQRPSTRRVQASEIKYHQPVTHLDYSFLIRGGTSS